VLFCLLRISLLGVWTKSTTAVKTEVAYQSSWPFISCVSGCVMCTLLQVPEDEDDTCELELPSPLDMAEMVRQAGRKAGGWAGRRAGRTGAT
jgi:hypothetical protein